MPDLIAKSTPPRNPLPPSLYVSPPSEPPPPPPPAPTPDPEWEKHEGFRFTFLLHFTLEEQEALQGIARLLYDAVLEKPRPLDLPEADAPWTLWELRTALGEIKYLEGYLMSIFREHQVSSLSPAAEKLSKMAGGIAHELSEAAHTLAKGLDAWSRKHPRGSR